MKLFATLSIALFYSIGIFASIDSIPKCFFYIEETAVFNGSISLYINNNIQYPDKAKTENIQGKVVTRFAINPDGNVINIGIIKSAHPLLDSEAIRLVANMPKWTPGKVNGYPGNVYFTLPINFSLDNETQTNDSVSAEELRIQAIHKDSIARNYPAQFIGKWYEFTQKRIHFPNEARYLQLPGVVNIQFLIEPDGAVSDITVFDSNNTGCNTEALRVAKLMAKKKWTPGKQNGENCRYYCILPFIFYNR